MSIDITRPHIGRIYDYVLGGTHNHEADRRAAEAILELVPAYPRWARLNRSFLGHVGKRWAALGVTRVLDLGSGLPTQGHFNEHLPGAKILFTDFDPLTVAQAQQLLAYTSDTAYALIDLTDPDALLEQASFFFEAERRLAVGCIGIMYFLSDDQIRSLMQRLHAFCAPGSVMALSFHQMPEGPDAELIKQALAESARHARVNFYLRTPEQMAELVTPWRTVVTRPLQEWVRDVAAPVIRPEDPIHRLTLFGAFAEH